MSRLQRSMRLSSLAGVLAAIIVAGVDAPGAVMLTAAGTTMQTGKPRVNPNAKAIAEFQEDVADYVELHRKLERTLPSLPKDASTEMVDEHQRALGLLIQRARKNARVGDVFERDVRPVLRQLLQGLFAGPEGAQLRRAVMEENPGEVVKRVVNGRYPDTIPISSMPPQILKALPPLPAELEYRFINTSLILLDVHAHIIVDYLIGAIPR